MAPETLFSITSTSVLLGWLALLFAPFARTLADRVAGLILPFILSIAYTAIILAFWGQAEGGFGSLADVMLLFTNPHAALAGWIHYLAYDLFVGAWIVRQGHRAAIPHLVLVPILIPAFLFGPAGYFLFIALRSFWNMRSQSRTES